MQDLPTISHNTPHNKGKIVGFLKHLVGQRPLTAALLLLVYFVVVSQLFILIFRPVVRSMHLSFLVGNLIGELVYALIVTIPILMLGWWSETGFTHGLDKRYGTLCIIPFALVVVPVLCVLPAMAGQAGVFTLVMSALIVLAIGFTEEGLVRGLLLRILLPKGIWFSVILTALLFASLHLLNLLGNYPLSFVMEQMIGALGTGMLLAALRLRSYSIWPAILLHASRDFYGIVQLSIDPQKVLATPSTAAIVVNIIYSLLFVLNAIFLLRPSRLQQLRIVYGLQAAEAVQPVAAVAPPDLPSYPAYIDPVE